MIQSIRPFLLFDGTCAEALAFYQQVFGSQILEKITFKEMPDSPHWQTAKDKQPGNRIACVTFKIGEVEIMASDNVLSEALGDVTRAALFVEIDSQTTIESLYKGLTIEGSQIVVPLGLTAYNSQYAKVIDPYGIAWELDYQM